MYLSLYGTQSGMSIVNMSLNVFIIIHVTIL